ncbi:GyrI-like domain-containing protein [Salmonirosea aquatica]|uniref:GyrI-like domain-containing protein n=1 Tax=Salmonirosea aquatica TaxID=2654236 RepID=UPI00357178BC
MREQETIGEFKIIGIAVRTTNENGQATQEIPALWNRFISEGMAGRIPNKMGESLYCVYTDYVLDHTQPYTTILGYKVTTLATIPEGMVGKTIPEGKYVRYLSKGNLMEGAVIGTWHEI